MNIALSTLTVLIILLPGVILRYSYLKGTWESPVKINNTFNELLFGIFFSIPMHIVWIYFIHIAADLSIDYEALFTILSGNINKDNIACIVKCFTLYWQLILLYFSTQFIGALLLGISLHKIVRFYHLDLRFRFFQFNNEWYYQLTGETKVIELAEKNRLYRKKFKENKSQECKKHPYNLKRRNIEKFLDYILATYIAVTIDNNGTKIIYYGELSNFYFGRNGELHKLVL